MTEGTLHKKEGLKYSKQTFLSSIVPANRTGFKGEQTEAEEMDVVKDIWFTKHSLPITNEQDRRGQHSGL